MSVTYVTVSLPGRVARRVHYGTSARVVRGVRHGVTLARSGVPVKGRLPRSGRAHPTGRRVIQRVSLALIRGVSPCVLRGVRQPATDYL